MNICVLIPCYNEANHIGDVVAALKEKGLPVFVVDDGSTDDTVVKAREAGAEVFTQETNTGKGNTLKAGINQVKALDYEGVIMMDGDGQHAVKDIDVFLKEIQENSNRVINGNRMARPDGMPVVRVFTNKFMSMIISWAARKRIPDTQCGYRYVGMNILRTLQLRTQGFEIETEILIRASKRGFDIISVPVSTIYADEESSIHPFRDTFKFIIYYFKELFRST